MYVALSVSLNISIYCVDICIRLMFVSLCVSVFILSVSVLLSLSAHMIILTPICTYILIYICAFTYGYIFAFIRIYFYLFSNRFIYLSYLYTFIHNTVSVDIAFFLSLLHVCFFIRVSIVSLYPYPYIHWYLNFAYRISICIPIYISIESAPVPPLEYRLVSIFIAIP